MVKIEPVSNVGFKNNSKWWKVSRIAVTSYFVLLSVAEKCKMYSHASLNGGDMFLEMCR
jgi:hypothetical protein